MDNTVTAAEIKRRGMGALNWLMSHPATGTRDKTDIDESVAEERAW